MDSTRLWQRDLCARVDCLRSHTILRRLALQGQLSGELAHSTLSNCGRGRWTGCSASQYRAIDLGTVHQSANA